jgi:hypothetical protein
VSTILDHLQERARRRQVDESIAKHLRAKYEFTRDGRHQVRREDVYRSCIEAVGGNFNNEMRGRVFDAAEKLGAIGIRPQGYATFAKMRVREDMPVPGNARGKAHQAAVARAWWARLTREGMGVEKDGAAPRLPSYNQFRSQINGAVIDMARDHYWMMHRELSIWGLYALDGMSERDIAERTGNTFAVVHDVVVRMRKAMDRFDHPTPSHETWSEGKAKG